MRRILVENARRKAWLKYGGGHRGVALTDDRLAVEPPGAGDGIADSPAPDAAPPRFEADRPRAAAAVSHPHAVTIRAVEPDGPAPFPVMESVAGRSPRQKLDVDGAPSLPEIPRSGSQTARGLAPAHGRGLIHRDVKRGNGLLASGVERVKLTDFGLTRLARRDRRPPAAQRPRGAIAVRRGGRRRARRSAPRRRPA